MSPFRRLWTLGYRTLLPITPPGAPASPNSTLSKRPNDMGKTPGVHGPYGWHSFGWQNHATLETDLDRWAGMGAGTGIRCGEQADGTHLALIDADTLSERWSADVAARVLRTFGPQPTRVGRAPKAGTVLRLSGPLGYRRVDFDDGTDFRTPPRVEILTAGRQFVAEGVHPVTREPYRWTIPLLPFDELPIFDPALVLAFLDELAAALPAAKTVAEGAGAAVEQSLLRGDAAMVRKAVAAIPNTSALFPTRESYLGVGYACRAAIADDCEARDVWAEWCGRWAEGDNDPERDDAEWRRMKPPFRRGASWLYELAERHGGGAFSRAMLHFEAPEETEGTEIPLFRIGDAAEDVAVRAGRFLIERLDDVARQALDETQPYLVKGLLDQNAMSVLYGDSNSGKTFVAMDLEYHVAAGLPWAGMKTCGGAVLHILSEGARGARRRAAALVRKYGPCPNFHVLLTSVNLFDPDADLHPLLAAMSAFGVPFVMVTVDTLARAIAGGDENSTKDMSAFVRNVDALKAGSKAHVMLVHHTGKDQSRGARGSSALRAATDTEIELEPGRIAVTKQRDLPKDWASAFALDVVRLGEDADGDPITSCTVALKDPLRALAEAGGPALTRAEQEVLTVVQGLGATAEKPVAVQEVLDALPGSGGAKGSAEAVRKHLGALVMKGRVERAKRGMYLLRSDTAVNFFEMFPEDRRLPD